MNLKRIKSSCRFPLFIVLFLALAIQSQAQSDITRILFVGNSYTYFWNLPQTVSAIAESQNKELYIRQSTAGGVNWKQHWEGDKDLTTRDKIESEKWDYIVLQNHSMSTINATNEFHDYGQKFIDLARKNGAKVVLYMTWAREFNPLMQETISREYRSLAKNAGVEIVPVGEVWEKSRELRPDLNLYDPDGSHPSPSGTYLTACLFYQFFTGSQIELIPPRLTTEDRNGEKAYLNIQDPGDATFMVELAKKYSGK